MGNCSTQIAKTKALITCTVFVFAAQIFPEKVFFFFFDSVLRPFQAFSLISRRINR